MEFHSIYKCRLCGKEYASGCTRNKTIALNSMIGASQNIPLVVQQPTLTDTHYCDDGSYGIADFQGFRKVEDNG